ncbi:MFS transporter [Streptomyces xiamenensis]
MAAAAERPAGAGWPVNESARRRRASAVLFTVFAVTGYQTGAWAVSLPAVVHDLDMGVGRLGLTLALMAAGGIVGALVTGQVAARVTTRSSVVAAAAASGVGYLSLAACQTATQFTVAAALTGVGLGVLDAAANAAGSQEEVGSGRRLLPRLHAAFSLTAALAVLASYAVEGGDGYTSALLLAGVACLAGALAAGALPGAARLAAAAAPTDEDDGGTRSGDGTESGGGGQNAGRGLSGLVVPVTVVAFVVVCGGFALDSTLEGYSALFIEQLPLQGAAQSAVGLTVLYLAGAVGRALSSPVLRRLGDWKTLLAGQATAMTGLLALVVDGSTWGIAAGMLLIGFGMSPAVPIAYSLVGRSRPFGQERAIARLTAAGYVTFTLAPLLVGLAGRNSLLDVFHALPVLLAGMAATVLWLGYRQRTARAARGGGDEMICPVAGPAAGQTSHRV